MGHISNFVNLISSHLPSVPQMQLAVLEKKFQALGSSFIQTLKSLSVSDASYHLNSGSEKEDF